MKYQFQHSVLGGTFDHFHVGHTKFVTTALAGAARVTIGLVKNPFSDIKLYPSSIEPYQLRKKALLTVLAKNSASSRASIIPLQDIFGTSLTDPTIDAIFVTQANHHNALMINNKRSILGLPPLAVQLVDYVLGDDDLVVNSGRIRAGLIDRLGHSYLKFLLQKPTHRLPESLRRKLQSPLGTVITNLDDLTQLLPPSPILITVGDITSLGLIKSGYHPSICIIDHHSRRQDIDPTTLMQYFPVSHQTIDNPAGTINPQFGPLLLTALSNSMQSNKTQIIKVDGEEDLLTLPTLLLSPLNSVVIYGQPKVGMCFVKVTQELKATIKHLIDQNYLITPK